jgi:hypothetical protein
MAKKTLKYCPDCDEEIPVSEFGNNIRNPSGLATYCRMHSQERVKVWKANNPDLVKAQMVRYIKRVKRRNKAGEKK